MLYVKLQEINGTSERWEEANPSFPMRMKLDREQGSIRRLWRK